MKQGIQAAVVWRFLIVLGTSHFNCIEKLLNIIDIEWVGEAEDFMYDTLNQKLITRQECNSLYGFSQFSN